MKKIIFSLGIMTSAATYAQNTGIGTTAPNASAQLDVAANNKGLLIPRIALTGTTDTTTIPSPATSLMVYNMATAGASPNNVAPGFYYWSGTQWQKVGGNDWSLSGNAGTTAGTNFLGTTDSQGLTLKTNGKLAMGIDTNQYVGIGTQNPLARFHIYSQNPGTPPGFANDMVFEYADGGTGTDDPFTLLYLRNGGTPTTPMNLRTGMTMMSNWIGTYVNGNRVPMAGISSVYRGNGSTTASDYNISVSGYVNNSLYIKENQNIGIGNNDPAERLDVNGNLKSRTINSNTGSSTDKVVVADTNGVLKTVDRSTISAPGWGLAGNAGTSSATNFLGTTDNQDLIFKRNNISAGILNSQNTAFGAGSMKSLSLASNMFNTAIGNDSQLSLTSGNANTSVGFASLRNITNGSGNTAVGNMAMMSTISGTDNVSIGKGAGNNSSTGGTGNILIGAGANKAFSTAGNYQLNIGDWIFGDNGKIGIGAAYKPSYGGLDNLTPGKTLTEQLEVDGSAKLLKINSAAYVGSSTDKTVVADANGVLKTLPAKPANSVGTAANNTAINLNVSGDYAPIILKKEPTAGFGNAGVEYKLELVNNLWQVTFAVINTGGSINYDILWVSNR